MSTSRAASSLSMAICILVLSSCPAVLGRTIYVDDDAPASGDGSSWTKAYRHLQDALTAARSTTGPVEIRVAQGLYRPDQGNPVVLGDRKAAFVLKSGIAMLGGFAGAGGPDPAAREIDAYLTVLSGDLKGNDLWWDDMTAAVPADVKNSHSDNSECIVDAGNSGPTAVLDGLYIKGVWYWERNLGRGETINLDRQGGLFIKGGSPTIRNCVFTENLSCSVKNVNYGNPTFTDCRFIRNHHTYSPALFTNSSDATISQCTFEGNVASYEGGAMVAAAGETTITDSTFSRNVALSGGGGAILNWWSNKIHLTRCDFRSNRAASTGGALSGGGEEFLEDCKFYYNSSGGAGAVFGGKLTVKGCDFHFNMATVGDGGALWSGAATIAESTFVGNRASSGGAMSFSRQDVTLEGCILSGNRGRNYGGAIKFGGPAVLTLNRCTLQGNRSIHGNSISAGSWEVVMKDSIVWDANAFWGYGNNKLSISYSNTHDAIEGPGNICIDPCFAQPGYWDPNDTPDDPNDDYWVEGDYHLKSQAGRWDPNSRTWVQDDVMSLCIDAGDPNSPVGGEPFPNGGRINMGAYGGTAEASKSYFGEPVCETVIAGDINGDCKVDWRDFEILSLHWLETSRE